MLSTWCRITGFVRINFIYSPSENEGAVVGEAVVSEAVVGEAVVGEAAVQKDVQVVATVA